MYAVQQEKRLNYIDIAKGIGILLVIIGHAFRDEMRENSGVFEFLGQLVYIFHMPLFFVLSGLTFGLSLRKHVKAPAHFFKKKVSTQFIPMLAYATVIYLCFFIAYQIPALQGVLSAADFRMYSYLQYLKLSALYDNPYTFHLWFLWILFLVSGITYICFYFGTNNRRMDVYFAAGTLILYVLSAFFSLPVLVQRLFRYFIFYAIGILLSSRQQLLLKKSKLANSAWVIAWLLVLAYCILRAFRFEMPILDETPLFIIFKLLASTCIIYSILKLSCKLECCKPLLYLGRESYSIYLLHQPVCCGLIGVVLYNKLHWPAFVVFIVCCVLSILFPAAVVAVCRKSKPLGKLAKCLFNIT